MTHRFHFRCPDCRKPIGTLPPKRCPGCKAPLDPELRKARAEAAASSGLGLRPLPPKVRIREARA